MEARVAMVRVESGSAAAEDVNDRLELRVHLSPQGHLDEVVNREAAVASVLTATGRAAIFSGCRLRRTASGWTLVDVGEEDPLWVVEANVIRPGDYVALRSPRSDDFIFRIVSVDTLGQ